MSNTAPHHAPDGTPASKVDQKIISKTGEGAAFATRLTDEMQALQDRAGHERHLPDPIETLSSQIGDELIDGTLSVETLEQIVRVLRDGNLVERAARLRSYLGLTDETAPLDRLDEAARKTVESCDTPDALIARLSRPGFAAVFTAHPTFALADSVYGHIVDMATTRPIVCLS
ncbi:hypothetical protein [Asaia astilbis]|uniref:hypothetical protein n=1 Tax=Asaia astilbis TaxID=610244 RepID=UPI000AE7F562|nr:hypothetical protein [Asaia astilbis]